MATPKTGFRLPAETVQQLAALAALDSPGRPNTTATLCRIIAAAHRAEGLPPITEAGPVVTPTRTTPARKRAPAKPKRAVPKR
jgi:hypothetical protein